MRKKSMFLSFTLVLTLLVMSIPSSAFAILEHKNLLETEQIKDNSSKEIIEVAGEQFVYERFYDENFTTVRVTGVDGILEAKRDKKTQDVKVSSNYLTEEEINKIQAEVANIIKSVNAQEEEVKAELSSPTGKITYGKWQNVTITTNYKIGVQAVILAIGIGLDVAGLPGSALAGFANIIVAEKMQTGYFKKRVNIRRATHPDYIWQRFQVRMYRDRARTRLLRSYTTAWGRFRVY